MKITLIEHTKLSSCVIAGRTAWDSFHKGGNYDTPTDSITEEDKQFIDRIVNKHKHGSVAEHIVYRISIKGVSRALLQEWSRHRIMSQTVQSSRYVLTKHLKDETEFNGLSDKERASKYVQFTDDDTVDLFIVDALENLRKAVCLGKSNDVIKYCMPEAFLTNIECTINARSLQNFLSLRSDKAALWEIRNLAWAMFNALPKDHKFLFVDHMKPIEN